MASNHLFILREYSGHETCENEWHDQHVGPLHDFGRQQLLRINALVNYEKKI